ncbi:MAG: hypothetical protein HYV09_08740 [Deltaproteobacteria bacterium]|nr:hypothetical protein [Deltaproteobacteria bacterium]
MGRWPVYTSKSSRHGRTPAPPPSRESTVKGTFAVAALLVASASARMALRRRHVRAAVELRELVERNREAFVRVRLPPEVFARYDDSAGLYRTVSGVRATLVGASGEEGDASEVVELQARVPVEYGEAAPAQRREAPRHLLGPHRDPVWLLARVVRDREGDATFRSGHAARLEPILERFVVVDDREGPHAPPAQHPSWARWVVYPVLFSLATIVLAVTADDGSSQLAWIVGLVVVGGFAELFAWVFFATSG